MNVKSEKSPGNGSKKYLMQKLNENLKSKLSNEAKKSRDNKPEEENKMKIALQNFQKLTETTEPLTCVHCKSSFNSHLDYGLHSSTHNRNSSFSCHLCDFLTTKSSAFKKHIKTHDKYKCKSCNTVLKTRLIAYIHFTRHQDQELVQCDICGKSVKKPYLNNHRTYHTKRSQNAVKCTICDKEYSRERYLLQHYSSVHKELGIDTTVVCDMCGFRTPYKEKLANHIKTHTGDRPFACSACPRRFITKTLLAYHFRMHTGDKRFECQYCGKKFTHRSSYQYHIKIHTGEKKFNCPGCNRGFISKVNMQKHLRSCNPHPNKA